MGSIHPYFKTQQLLGRELIKVKRIYILPYITPVTMNREVQMPDAYKFKRKRSSLIITVSAFNSLKIRNKAHKPICGATEEVDYYFKNASNLSASNSLEIGMLH